MGRSIHPTAIVASGAELGEDVIVGPYAVIEDDVRIGARTRVDSHAVIKRHTRMGEDNHVHSHAVVGGEPQDLKFAGETTLLEIGDGNSIREFATIHRGTAGGGGVTRLGNRNLCMAYTHVAHDCILGDGIVMSNAATLAGHIEVGSHAIIGGLAAVHQFCRIGEHAFVGGMTGVAQDLPPWMLAVGSRALVHGPNLVGLRRAGASQQTIAAFKTAFRLVWKSDMPRAEALDLLLADAGDIPEIRDFVTFVRASSRGVCPAEKISARGLDEEGTTR